MDIRIAVAVSHQKVFDVANDYKDDPYMIGNVFGSGYCFYYLAGVSKGRLAMLIEACIDEGCPSLVIYPMLSGDGLRIGSK